MEGSTAPWNWPACNPEFEVDLVVEEIDFDQWVLRFPGDEGNENSVTHLRVETPIEHNSWERFPA